MSSVNLGGSGTPGGASNRVKNCKGLRVKANVSFIGEYSFFERRVHVRK